MAKIFYCPYCGQTYNLCISNHTMCQNCLTENVEFAVAEHDSSYYRKISIEKYGNMMHINDILFEEISSNPLFDTEKSKITTFKDRENGKISKLLSQNINKEKPIPKCPTCGSTDIKPISTLKKATHAYAFGLFSKIARSQFECQNCHYKW